jgi:hypothetical protein
MAIPTAEQIALVQRLLPSAAMDSEADGGYGWDANYITVLMTENNFTPTRAVRFFWLQRVNETSEYLDLTGKPITDIHKQAKEMLDYWDNILLRFGANAIDSKSGTGLAFGEIELPPSYRRISHYFGNNEWEGVELTDDSPHF